MTGRPSARNLSRSRGIVAVSDDRHRRRAVPFRLVRRCRVDSLPQRPDGAVHRLAVVTGLPQQRVPVVVDEAARRQLRVEPVEVRHDRFRQHVGAGQQPVEKHGPAQVPATLRLRQGGGPRQVQIHHRGEGLGIDVRRVALEGDGQLRRLVHRLIVEDRPRAPGILIPVQPVPQTEHQTIAHPGLPARSVSAPPHARSRRVQIPAAASLAGGHQR
ncbi:hypothetical protein AB0M02_38400 [Actinoplanes sp. NPDC051861]|uniref:hypothetical protein n=1 Tax=Actinoplanes sp. NPDC051861 TaxID=3155170 RepID=UPI003434B7AB